MKMKNKTKQSVSINMVARLTAMIGVANIILLEIAYISKRTFV